MNRSRNGGSVDASGSGSGSSAIRTPCYNDLGGQDQSHYSVRRAARRREAASLFPAGDLKSKIGYREIPSERLKPLEVAVAPQADKLACLADSASERVGWHPKIDHEQLRRECLK